MTPKHRIHFQAIAASMLTAALSWIIAAGMDTMTARAQVLPDADKDNNGGEILKSGLLGISYSAGPNGFPLVSDVYKDSPAAKAGLKKGDELEAVDNVDTRLTGYLHLQSLLSGEKGSTVILKVRGKDIRLVRAPLMQFNDAALKKQTIERFHEGPQSQLKDLPFALLARVGNKPTLFEFVEKGGTTDIGERLKKHNDGAYILSQCKIVRLTPADKSFAPLRNYFALSGAYSLVPVYSPWLVTVKTSDILSGPPSQEALDKIASNLVHNSIKAKTAPLSQIHGLSHKTVIKRICEQMPRGSGVAGLGFGAGPDGHALITEVFKGGPADQAELKPGDEIRSINGQDTRYLGLEHIQAELLGKPGETVKLVIGQNQTPPGHALTVSAENVDRESTAAATAKATATTDGDLTRTVNLTFAPLYGARLGNLHVAIWKQEASSDQSDSDEYELPCCMVGKAQAKPTIFELCQNDQEAGIKVLIEKLKAEKKLPTDLCDLQVVRYTAKDSDYAGLRQYFQLKSNYACLPLYSRSRHRTIKANQIKLSVPTQLSDALHLIGVDN
ncbi:MAG: PDZ domain-containing protein [Cyanobacteria bacterium REEB67]|nr:PDZ domain-containing protein [Cyanobacteria bacterium REEB67]